jgi:cation diffusion facilitator CzcD-associated flavoprotein CzcO
VRDPELRAKVTPGYLLGCKRILFSNDFLQTLTATTSRSTRPACARCGATRSSVRTARQAEVDAIILGTGFHILDSPMAGLIRGVDGRTMAEHWAGSPEAYLGTVVAGFPNHFVVLGPSLGTGHTSAFQITEAQVGYIVDAVRWARAEEAVLDVRPEVQASYVDEVQAGLVGTAYNASSCSSYYVDVNGRNSFSWPWSTGELVRRVSRFDAADFRTTAPETVEVTA